MLYFSPLRWWIRRIASAPQSILAVYTQASPNVTTPRLGIEIYWWSLPDFHMDLEFVRWGDIF